jgi:hypothetical protein
LDARHSGFIGEGVQLVVGDAVEETEARALHSLDLVVSIDAAYHFVSRRRWLAAVQRALNPEHGTLVLVDIVLDTSRLGRALAWLVRTAGYGGRAGGSSAWDNFSVVGRDSLDTELSGAGFSGWDSVLITDRVFPPFRRAVASRLCSPLTWLSAPLTSVAMTALAILLTIAPLDVVLVRATA